MVYKVISFLLVLGIGVISYFYGGLISYSIQISIYDTLLNVSAIIFGVMGAWVAIVYPDALSRVFKKGTELEENRSNIQRLFAPMRVATIIVALSTLLKWIVPVLKNIQWIINNKECFLGISFFILGIMIFALIWSLILTFIPMEMVNKQIHDKTEVAKGLGRKRGRVQNIEKE